MTWRGFSSPDQPGRGISESMESILRRLHIAGKDTMEVVNQHWREIVGDELADYATPLLLRDGALWVEVRDPQCRMELKWSGGSIATRLNAHLGGNVVERLVLKDHKSTP